jgi:hypothetical protein
VSEQERAPESSTMQSPSTHRKRAAAEVEGNGGDSDEVHEVYVLDMDAPRSPNTTGDLMVWGVDDDGNRLDFGVPRKWTTYTVKVQKQGEEDDPQGEAALLAQVRHLAKRQGVFSTGPDSKPCQMCSRFVHGAVSIAVVKVRLYESGGSKRARFALRVCAPAPHATCGCAFSSGLRFRVQHLHRLCTWADLRTVHTERNGVMETATGLDMGGWMRVCLERKRGTDNGETRRCLSLQRMERRTDDVPCLMILYLCEGKARLVQADSRTRDRFILEGSASTPAGIVELLAAAQVLVVGWTPREAVRWCIQQLPGRKPLVIDVEVAFGRLGSGATGLRSGYKLGTVPEGSRPDTGRLQQLHCHDVGPVNVAKETVELLMALERVRCVVHTALTQQATSNVSASSSALANDDFPSGRPTRLAFMMFRVAARKGYVYDSSVALHDADRKVRGGIYWHGVMPPMVQDTCEMDFVGHYPNTCIALNISLETRTQTHASDGSTVRVQDARRCLGPGNCKGPECADWETRPFHMEDTDSVYRLSSASCEMGVLPVLLSEFIARRCASKSKGADPRCSSREVAQHTATAQWHKEEGCSVVGVMGTSRPGANLRDFQTANDILAAARGHIAATCNLLCSQFATCLTCQRTHFWPLQGSDQADGTMAEVEVNRFPCKSPVRGKPVQLVSIVTDSVRFALSPNDRIGGPVGLKAVADWMTARVQSMLFSRLPPIRMGPAQVDQAYLQLSGRSYFAMPACPVEASDPMQWMCKGRVGNSNSGLCAEQRLLRGALAFAVCDYAGYGSACRETAVAEVLAGASVCATEHESVDAVIARVLSSCGPLEEYVAKLQVELRRATRVGPRTIYVADLTPWLSRGQVCANGRGSVTDSGGEGERVTALGPPDGLGSGSGQRAPGGPEQEQRVLGNPHGEGHADFDGGCQEGGGRSPHSRQREDWRATDRCQRWGTTAK